MSARSPFRRLPLLALMTLLLGAVIACQPKTPEEKIAAARAAYTVELNSWFPQEPEPEVVAEDVAGEDPAGEAEAGAEAAEAAAVAEEAVEAGEGEGEGELEFVEVDNVGPRTVNVLFDLIVQFNGDEPLPGLTLEITRADASGNEKASMRHYQELPEHIKGDTKQVSFKLEGLEFEDGDGYSVTVRKVVPPEEQGEYREFASAGQ